jgi:hypothetical protein
LYGKLPQAVSVWRFDFSPRCIAMAGEWFGTPTGLVAVR